MKSYTLHILFAVAMLIGLVGCQAKQNLEVPGELIGTWKTSDPKYADRFLEITESMIYFGTGGQSFDLNPIWHIEARDNGSLVFYTISYFHPTGREFKLSLIHHRSRDLIALKNQPRIKWARERT